MGKNLLQQQGWVAGRPMRADLKCPEPQWAFPTHQDVVRRKRSFKKKSSFFEKKNQKTFVCLVPRQVPQ
jgi:hypothetical protein